LAFHSPGVVPSQAKIICHFSNFGRMRAKKAQWPCLRPRAKGRGGTRRKGLEEQDDIAATAQAQKS
jgi:hypothetical protein